MSKSENIRKKLPADYEKTPGYLLWDISEAIGQEMELQDNEINRARELFDVDNLTGEMLERFIRQRKGLIRKAATHASGELQVQGFGTVTTGDLFETENGVQFAATETVTIDGSGTVRIEAVEGGNVGIVGANTITQMPVTLEGITLCNNREATEGGYDAETDDSLRNRYYTKLRTPDSGANKYAYRNWALEVSGVGDAKVFPLGHGDNTVDVVVIDAEKKPASDTLVKAVQDYIDPGSEGKGEGVAMIGAHCYVSSAAGLWVDVTGKITMTATQAELERAIKKSIERYLASIAYSGRNVSYAQISNAIIETEGVIDIEGLMINEGTANIAVPERSVAVLGVVTFTYA
ncbi:baseplate J/gp47 family protein [Senimuribacter intestinalis]|uniref:baseplate J/gp47 family protein n=1 Tax=Senimuribacter intestinalis TaxID=2941507 RepID=UPI00203AE0EB|nr:baseplate J/gp47 family protein [Senimuribacter intestinalis]